ncbi:YciI family protein [Beggiatoa leptomitoformis]|uniref:YciI family protein n=1 Tax=Beggiatoa leptomitoformis TaxID=288004 RepID=A0A2N9YEL2_9GAMM|nr:YciI family protein [Beggiatoa leptomitoformis]ALG68739.1 YciI family protein [Beggiatoa leptomitoformis]AUI68902.1 YciI family protein [Beggiatoa leptomitoformis]
MLYAIFCEDAPDSLDTRIKVRPAHLQRLETLKAQGRLVLAGPHPAIDATDPGAAGFTGSLIVAEFATSEEAYAWAEQDPYKQSGVYAKINIKPFKKVFP